MTILDYRNAWGICTICGQRDELRPYGKGGALVCFDCMMKDEKEAKRQFGRLIKGAKTLVCLSDTDLLRADAPSQAPRKVK
jgi:hypothetical protein